MLWNTGNKPTSHIYSVANIPNVCMGKKAIPIHTILLYCVIMLSRIANRCLAMVKCYRSPFLTRITMYNEIHALYVKPT